jgi:HD-like signal output (HDOD) protein
MGVKTTPGDTSNDMNNFTEKDLLNRLRKGYSIPPLSPVAIKLVELATDDRCSASDLANLIEKDPSLSVRLLKLANSAFFRTLYPVTTLKQAVVKIGFHRLRIMALSVSIRDAFPMGKIGALDYETFWRQSIYRALIARYLATEIKKCSSEEAFVAALIMEVGLLIFFELFLKNSAESTVLELTPLSSLLAWEKENYGMTHREIGEVALKYWNFPDHLVLCQKADSKSLSSEDSHPLAKVCELARIFSQLIFPKFDPFDVPYETAERYFGLEPNTIDSILLTTFETVEDIAGSLRVKINREEDMLKLLEKANMTLSRISDQLTESSQDQGILPFPTLDLDGKLADATVKTLQAVAHEIRNPLTVIGGFARRLVASVDMDSAESKYALIIIEEAARLESLLSKMIGMAHAQEKSDPPASKPKRSQKTSTPQK